jgi:hypothetical protein
VCFFGSIKKLPKVSNRPIWSPWFLVSFQPNASEEFCLMRIPLQINLLIDWSAEGTQGQRSNLEFVRHVQMQIFFLSELENCRGGSGLGFFPALATL